MATAERKHDFGYFMASIRSLVRAGKLPVEFTEAELKAQAEQLKLKVGEVLTFAAIALKKGFFEEAIFEDREEVGYRVVMKPVERLPQALYVMFSNPLDRTRHYVPLLQALRVQLAINGEEELSAATVGEVIAAAVDMPQLAVEHRRTIIELMVDDGMLRPTEPHREDTMYRVTPKARIALSEHAKAEELLHAAQSQISPPATVSAPPPNPAPSPPPDPPTETAAPIAAGPPVEMVLASDPSEHGPIDLASPMPIPELVIDRYIYGLSAERLDRLWALFWLYEFEWFGSWYLEHAELVGCTAGALQQTFLAVKHRLLEPREIGVWRFKRSAVEAQLPEWVEAVKLKRTHTAWIRALAKAIQPANDLTGDSATAVAGNDATVAAGAEELAELAARCEQSETVVADLRQQLSELQQQVGELEATLQAQLAATARALHGQHLAHLSAPWRDRLLALLAAEPSADDGK